MKLLLQKIRSFWIGLLILAVACQTAHALKYEKPLSLQIENLTRWRNSAEASAIQQGLGAMIKPRPDYPRSPKPFEGAKEYSFLYGRPFLVLAAEPNGFGGFWGVIVFNGYPRVLGLWLYDLGKDGTGWEIRSIEPFRLKIPNIILDELSDERVQPFWLNASINW